MTDSRRIVFRADGDAAIGMGHVMRCLALADMLGHTYRLAFAMAKPSDSIRNLLTERRIDLISLSSATLSDFLPALRPSDVVVLDGYTFDAAFQRAVREAVQALVFIDDVITGHQVADVVINQAGGLNPNDYSGEPYVQYCLGPTFAMLRQPFLQPPGFQNPNPDGPFLVSLGGADPQNVSLAVLQAIRAANPNQAVRLVAGPFHPDRAGLEAYTAALPNLNILSNLNANQMADEVAGCSLAITSASTVAYEVCAVHRPLIAIQTADNQAKIAQFLNDEKLALSVHFPKLLHQLKPSVSLETALRMALMAYTFSGENANESLAQQARWFDGRSPERFRALFNQLMAETRYSH